MTPVVSVWSSPNCRDNKQEQKMRSLTSHALDTPNSMTYYYNDLKWIEYSSTIANLDSLHIQLSNSRNSWFQEPSLFPSSMNQGRIDLKEEKQIYLLCSFKHTSGENRFWRKKIRLPGFQWQRLFDQQEGQRSCPQLGDEACPRVH